MRRVRVIPLHAKLGVLDYGLPEDMAPAPGDLVQVPLGRAQAYAMVCDQPPDPSFDPAKLKMVTAPLDAPPIARPLRALIDWTADYYVAPPSAVLRMVLASGVGLGPAKRGDAAIPAQPNPLHQPPKFAPAQSDAAHVLRTAVGAAGFDPIVLDGVTGSGKTEVYFEAVAEALARGRQTLVLLPEIALTTPFLGRFAARFGCAPVAWHSELTPAQRRRAFRAIVAGTAPVVVGARSALFLPYAKLGLIVVDEAHETSFKQEEGVPYHARDVAVMRARFEAIPVVLATATPALETQVQIGRGLYRAVHLPDRFGGARLPKIEAVDLLVHPPARGQWIAPPLIDALRETLARGEQSLLFLNRRGYAPLTLCRTCGHRFRCPDCSAWMVEHRRQYRLLCHHCGHNIPVPQRCPDCGDDDSLVACGPGVERIDAELATLFPDARRAVATSDTLSTAAKVEAFVAAMSARTIDMVVGTQLVTKGYHFPALTLVGVIDADLGLQGGDLRAAERCFQQIAQVAGRAGRADKPGHVLLQTRDLRAPVITALLRGDAASFYATETAMRQSADAPPFGRYGALIVSGPELPAVLRCAEDVARAAPPTRNIHIYGPAAAPIALLRGRHRQRLLIHATRQAPLQDYIRALLAAVKLPRDVRITVDIDPYSFM